VLAYVNFILERVKDKNSDGSIEIMYTIHGIPIYDIWKLALTHFNAGDKFFHKVEFTHLDGHKGSKPVWSVTRDVCSASHTQTV
jgi:hypothetical protein